MTRPTTVLAAMAFVTAAGFAHAQPVNTRAFRKDMVASGVLLLPRGDFQRALQTIGYGGGFHGLFAIGSRPASAGVDSQLMFYARDGRNHDMMLTAHGLARVGQRLGPHRRYAEALAGIKGFSAEGNTRIGTFSYGVGIGMQFPRARSTSTGAPEQEVVEIGVRYLRGGGARVDGQRFASTTHSVMLHVGWGLQF